MTRRARRTNNSIAAELRRNFNWNLRTYGVLSDQVTAALLEYYDFQEKRGMVSEEIKPYVNIIRESYERKISEPLNHAKPI